MDAGVQCAKQVAEQTSEDSGTVYSTKRSILITKRPVVSYLCVSGSPDWWIRTLTIVLAIKDTIREIKWKGKSKNAGVLMQVKIEIIFRYRHSFVEQ